MALLDHWRGQGATVLNGPEVMAIDSSKARQLSLLHRLGLHAPRTRVVHRAADLAGAAEEIGFPLLVKANIGGSGAGIMRFDSAAELAAVVAAGDHPRSVDQVLLVQEAVPARDGMIWRLETLGGKFLYALEIAGARPVRPLPGRCLRRRARADPYARVRSARRDRRCRRAHRAGDGNGCRRDRSHDRRPRRVGQILRHQRVVQLRRAAGRGARLRPARPAGGLAQDNALWRHGHEIRILDAGVRRLASQRSR